MCDIYFIGICSFNVIIEDASDRLHFTFWRHVGRASVPFYGRIQIHEKKKLKLSIFHEYCLN